MSNSQDFLTSVSIHTVHMDDNAHPCDKHPGCEAVQNQIAYCLGYGINIC